MSASTTETQKAIAILTKHILDSGVLSSMVGVREAVSSCILLTELDYHHMLLGLHGDCDEEDVVKAIGMRNRLINALYRWTKPSNTVSQHVKGLCVACANACYEYARYVSDSIVLENRHEG